jgi:flagellar biosynthetic protein FliR
MNAASFDLALLASVSTMALVSVRFLGLFLALPLLAFRAFPVSLRVAPVLLLTLVAAPRVELSAAQWQALGPLSVLSELAIGVVTGLSLRLAMLAVDFVAEALSMHAGFSFAQTVAPDSSLPTTALGELLGMSVLAVLFANDVHLLFIERIADSFAIVPFGAWPTGWDLPGLLTLMGRAFSIGLVLSCGSFALYLFTNTMLGMINRISPQLNLMSVGFSISAPLALVVMALLTFQLPVLAELIANSALEFVDLGLRHVR